MIAMLVLAAALIAAGIAIPGGIWLVVAGIAVLFIPVAD